MVELPRFLLAAPASGGGKTTLATGIMAALSRRGHAVAPFKVGPDYIDPGYHSLATGRPGRNLDAVMCGEELIAPLLAHGAAGCEVAVIEGVMGLFDGQLGSRGRGSSAHVAVLTSTPVVLVIDCSHASRTHAAVVNGLATYRDDLRIAGVILNKVASPRHGDEVAAGVSELGIPVLGRLPRTDAIQVPSRHLGLVPAAERDESAAQLDTLARAVEEAVDLDAVLAIAQTAPTLAAQPWDPRSVVSPSGPERPRIAVAAGRAFTFRYAELAELLTAAGCDVVEFDPLADLSLPDGSSGLYVGGGFPEVHAAELAANTSLHQAIAAAAAAGMPIVAECAGLLLLCRGLEGHAMSGVVPAEAAMGKPLTMGYRTAVAPGDTLLFDAGTIVTGHEFHRTQLTPLADFAPAWRFELPDGSTRDDGASLGSVPNVHASYLHLHWAATPQAALRFADAARRFRPDRASSPSKTAPAPNAEADLLHHGDRDSGAGLLNFAVNVQGLRPPAWLLADVAVSAETWGSYPDVDPARRALAAHHDVDPDMVLPTAGAAEAFTLIARGLDITRPLVVHPQFTEPEAALRAAGHTVDRLVLGAAGGFRLNPNAVPRDADLIILGNPTNPTGVLHPADAIASLCRPGRVVVVDEAFMDAAGEVESLIRAELPGLLVVRSLTKTFALAGLRAGYVVGDPPLIPQLQAQQPPWSVSTPAIAAMIACVSPAGAAHAREFANGLPARRSELTARLQHLGLTVVAESQAPFVLVDTSPLSATGSIRLALAERGIAVRRGESFPGLGPTWLRLAVRDTPEHDILLAALADLLKAKGLTR